MTLSLRQRIFWWSVATTLIVLLAISVFVDRTVRTTIRTGLEENLRAGALLAAELHRSEVDEGLQATASFADAPTLRAAAETGDSATIRQNLEIFLAGTGESWLALLGPEGGVVAATREAPTERMSAAEPLFQEARFYDTGDLWRLDGRLVEVHASGVFFGTTLLGVFVSGSEIGTERVGRLERATGGRIAFLSGGQLVAGGAGLPPQDSARLVEGLVVGEPEGSRDWATAGVAGPLTAFTLDGERYLGTAVPLPDASGREVGHLVAFRSLDEAMAPAWRLRVALVVIGAVAVILALASSYVLTHSVTRPVDRLLRETVRLGSGDLDVPVEPGRDDELGELAEGFETMRVSLKDARDELVRAERLSAIGRAASAIVHDFSQPVTAISGHVQLLELDWADEQARGEDVHVIRREIDRLNTMMREILDFSRGAEAIRVTRESVPGLLDDVASTARLYVRDRNIELDVEHGYRGEWSLDFPRTARVLGNLVRNAAAAIGSGGTIRLASRVEGDRLRLTVTDDGPGVPEGIRETLFDPFVTHGRKEGTGLGLAIARSFTERQGGSIHFETSAEGTEFILEFPADGAAPAPDRTPSPIEGGTLA